MDLLKIPMNPEAWKRPRRCKNRYFDLQVAQKLALATQVMAGLRLTAPHTGPVELEVNFALAMPPSWPKKKRKELLGMPHSGKPDLDNLVKFVCDALNRVLWDDDRKIVSIKASKIWSDEGYIELGCTHVEVDRGS